MQNIRQFEGKDLTFQPREEALRKRRSQSQNYCNRGSSAVKHEQGEEEEKKIDCIQTQNIEGSELDKDKHTQPSRKTVAQQLGFE